MKIVFISDTHGRHNYVKLPEGDILIHSGDLTSRGDIFEIAHFISWLNKLTFKHIIFIAGNHDFYLEKHSIDDFKDFLPNNAIYLNDSGCEIEGVKFWGSPIQPEFLNWAFNRERGVDIKKHWDLIPNDTDVLITHGSPYGILDQTVRGDKIGCEDLLKKVLEIRPKIHAFGHIHEAYGIKNINETTFVNASLLNERYRYTNDPIVLEV
ncbi:Icc-related predicted phosphoesterase [Wenyingzhuangia heitensis]|uniref:Icc-related predicted phosphoesterase n=1 Tax=Wenyingzhuangia heitensis TaxID=1487859 RepID=A0ABX0U7X7_9FLAO|nr:metallophosphatase domain-containing protein [Wenyingzhuangia heitensis]NIJ44439.1 Icc-related predicted phosphoesterase [Wenyingzhuangia heitensis]